MLASLLKTVFGSANDRLVTGMLRRAERITALEPTMKALSDEELRAKTAEFRKRLADGTKLDALQEEAFAVVREASTRVLGMRHFDVQLVGAMVLHSGSIAEMKTGEGKTLVATLPVYLNALSGKGVHVVTVNDYLARRDAAWMGRLYNFLGMSVGVIVPGLDDAARRAAYGADITYGTNNEFGFDYLRDNLKFRLNEMVQRDFNYAIVDEVDSILVDEARTPLIISGPAGDSSELYIAIDKVIPQLTEEDYEKDEKARAVTLTEEGTEHVEQILRAMEMLKEGGLYDVANVSLVHHVNQALRAHKLFARDTDYIVKDDKVVIIDEFTGRMMEGRRFSEGLHQALEAKEHVYIQAENQTLASITFQNYFRMYPKLAGMTGTAMTEAAEFGEIYKLDVVEIPTNRPAQRKDNDDEVYRTRRERDEAVIDQIATCHAKGQPVLVGTVSIEKSESLAEKLVARGIPHNVLNARQHEREAYIVAEAGAPGAVTIATNMAGRGTDIQLGGNVDMRIAREVEEGKLDPATDADRIAALRASIEADVATRKQAVLGAGGLYIIGTERHESRRIDNQLRGRSGRQGDPGESKFFISLEDDLMRIFGSERMDGMLRKLGLKDGEAIAHPWVNKALEKAQQKVEARNFEIRKQLLKYDDVMNDQRKVVFEQRKELMRAENVHETVTDMRAEALDGLVARAMPENAMPDAWDVALLHEESQRLFGLNLPLADWMKEEGIADQEIRERIWKALESKMAKKEADYGPELMRMAEKSMLLQVLDHMWKEHLLQLDHLRQGVGLRAYAQRDPLMEYKREAFNLFETMLIRLREQVTLILSHLEMRIETAESAMQPPPAPQGAVASHPDPDAAAAQGGSAAAAGPEIDPNDPRTWGKVARNAACPCGSGKKYKHCHGQA